MGRRKNGPARILSQPEIENVFEVLKQHRYFEKNHAILLLSFELGLTPKELASLNLVDVASLSSKAHFGDVQLRESVRLRNPKSQKIGSNRTQSSYQRKYTFSLAELTRLVTKVLDDYPAEFPLDLQKYLPKPELHRKYTRVLPINSERLKRALVAHIDKHPFLIRIGDQPPKPLNEIPLFVSQKRGRYSPNTMQDQMRLMLAGWAGLEGASGLSGRRTLADKMVREGIPIKTIQQYLGHQSPSTTVLHEDIDFSECHDQAYAFSKVRNENSKR